MGNKQELANQSDQALQNFLKDYKQEGKEHNEIIGLEAVLYNRIARGTGARFSVD